MSRQYVFGGANAQRAEAEMRATSAMHGASGLRTDIVEVGTSGRALVEVSCEGMLCLTMALYYRSK
jgi:hypothetical protein